MAKKDNAPPQKEKKSKKKLIFIALLLLLLACGVAFGVSWFLNRDKGDVYEPRPFTYIQLTPEILEFSYTYLPDVYRDISVMDDEMVRVDGEVARLDEIITTYPAQQKIPIAQKKIWLKVNKTAQKSLAKIEKTISMFYVTFIVNKTKGETVLADKSNELIAAANDAKTALTTATDTLEKLPAPKSIMDKALGLIGMGGNDSPPEENPDPDKADEPAPEEEKSPETK